ncbi:hypothetical protein D3C71_2134290 [compost metagenome]
MFFRCTHADGRVVVSDEIEGNSVSPVPGDTWQEARARIDMKRISYVPGHGWCWDVCLPKK